MPRHPGTREGWGGGGHKVAWPRTDSSRYGSRLLFQAVLPPVKINKTRMLPDNVMSSTEENPVPIVGYADRLSVQPGEAIRFMISCDFAWYKAEIVRLRSADCRPKGPARQEEAVQTQVSGETRRKQTYPHGSYGIIATDSRPPSLGSFSIQCWIFPTTPQGGVQGIVTSANESKGPGLGLYIDGKGAVALVVKDSTGRVEWMRTEKPLRSHTWYFVAATYDGDTGGATAYQVPQRLFPGDQSAAQVQRRVVPLSGAGLSHSPILIGASWGNEEVEPFPIKLFNGKIENPRIFSRALGAADIDAIRGGATLNALGSTWWPTGIFRRESRPTS